MAKQSSLLGGLPKRAEKARARAEKMLRSAWKQALDALPPRPRKAVKDVTARLEKATTQLQRRRDRAFKEVNARRDRLVSDVEHRAAKVVKPLVRRLDVASRADVERLSKRINQLERQMHQKPRQQPVAAA